MTQLRTRRARALAVIALTMALAAAFAPGSSGNTLGPGLGPSPNNPVTYQPLKHVCVSPFPERICQDFTNDIETSLNGQIVSIFYPQSYFCDPSISSGSPSGCEWGQKANKLPPGVAGWKYTDPLYLEIPWGPLLKANPKALQPECQFTGHCTDHPSTVDFSRVAGSGFANFPLPIHNHFETFRNGNRPEWHNLSMFLVRNKTSWFAPEQSHDVKTLYRLASTPGSGVTGPYPSNIFFFFQTLPGTPHPQEVAWAMKPHPFITRTTQQDPSIITNRDSLLDRTFQLAGKPATLRAWFGSPDRTRTYRVIPMHGP